MQVDKFSEGLHWRDMEFCSGNPALNKIQYGNAHDHVDPLRLSIFVLYKQIHRRF